MSAGSATGAIHGYGYGSAEAPTSPVSLAELEQLEVTVGTGADEERYLRLAGDVLAASLTG